PRSAASAFRKRLFTKLRLPHAGNPPHPGCLADEQCSPASSVSPTPIIQPLGSGCFGTCTEWIVPFSRQSTSLHGFATSFTHPSVPHPTLHRVIAGQDRPSLRKPTAGG